MTRKKLDVLLTMKDVTQTQIADKRNVSRQSISRKFRNSATAFNLKDLIELAEMTNTSLAFVDPDGSIVVKFDISDIKETE